MNQEWRNKQICVVSTEFRYGDHKKCDENNSTTLVVSAIRCPTDKFFPFEFGRRHPLYVFHRLAVLSWQKWFIHSEYNKCRVRIRTRIPLIVAITGNFVARVRRAEGWVCAQHAIKYLKNIARIDALVQYTDWFGRRYFGVIYYCRGHSFDIKISNSMDKFRPVT